MNTMQFKYIKKQDKVHKKCKKITNHDVTGDQDEFQCAEFRLKILRRGILTSFKT